MRWGAKTMLEIVPISLAEANQYVSEHHRHHKPVVGHKFSVGCTDGENIVGVAIVGRPVARYLDDGWTLEVNRLCTDGTRNACSMLYAAAWRAARAMGYRKIITYILDTEPGTSLRAAGWKCVGDVVKLLPYCDEAKFFDNDNGFVLVAEYRNGELLPVGDKRPAWLLELIATINQHNVQL